VSKEVLTLDAVRNDAKAAAAAPTRGRQLLLLLLSLVQFIVVLDSLSISVALPSIGGELRLSSGGLTWILQAYMLTYGGFLGVAGRAGDFFGHRRMLAIGLVVFAAASLAAGLAQNLPVMLCGRAGQGMGAALILPAAMTLLTAGRSPEGQTRVLAVWSAVGGAGVVAGALVGGVVTDALGWRWLFLLNIPIALLVLAAAPLFAGGRSAVRHNLDVAGALLLTTGVACFLYALAGPRPFSPDDPLRLAALPIGALVLAAFVYSQRRQQDPLVPDRILRARKRRAASVGAVALNGGFAAILVFGSAQLQQVLDYSALGAGLALLPLAGLAALATVPAARLSNRFPPVRVAAAGLAAMGFGFYLLTAAPVGGFYMTSFLPGSLLLGAGISLAYVPLTLLAVGPVPESERGIASGVYNTFGQVGSAVVLAIVTAAAIALSGNDHEGLEPDALSGEVVNNAYACVTGLLLLGAFFTWWTAHRSKRSRQPD
jgi:EmrB/QacA subfamily drug resistance transporter